MEIGVKRDGHIHTPFCPHGTKDSLEDYVYEALKRGRQEITFTEHFPLPAGVTTERFARECSILDEEVSDYLKAVEVVQKKFEKEIRIYKGFEVDYIEGFEKEIKERLNLYGKAIEDGILSVHFVKYKERYYAIDYLPDFKALVSQIGGLQEVYDLYFKTLLKSIEADLGAFKPKRIGHPTLIRIFNQKYPFDYEDKGLFKQIAQSLLKGGYEVDWNVAGLRKESCKEIYPSGELVKYIQRYEIKCVGGSDAHSITHMSLLDGYGK